MSVDLASKAWARLAPRRDAKYWETTANPHAHTLENKEDVDEILATMEILVDS